MQKSCKWAIGSRRETKMDVKVEGYVEHTDADNVPVDALQPFDAIFLPVVKQEFKSEVQHDGSQCDVIVKLETCTEEQNIEELRLEEFEEAEVSGESTKDADSTKKSNSSGTDGIYRVCDKCGKGFTHASNFQRHKMIHSEEKSFECEVCGKGFNVPRDLKSHLQIHSGRRPYKCDICGRLFRRPGHLKGHKMTHSGERPYTCDLCGKSFGHKDTLKSHKRMHSGEKPYKCDECGRVFSHRGTLTSHKISHSGKRPHQCDLCGKLFVRMWHLKTHKQLIHFPKKKKKDL